MGCFKLENIDYVHLRKINFSSQSTVETEGNAPIFCLNTYPYGFQGQEKDDEVKGEGNSINYEYRMHDPRVGRFFKIDPLARDYPYWSPYAFSGNQVIHTVELEGLEVEDNLNEHEKVIDFKEVKVYSAPYVQGVSGDGIGGTEYNPFGSIFNPVWQANTFADAVEGIAQTRYKIKVWVPRNTDLGKEIISKLASDHGIMFSDLSRRDQKKLLSVRWGKGGFFSRGDSDRSDLFFYKKSSVVYSSLGIRVLPVSVPIVLPTEGVGTMTEQSDIIIDNEALATSIVNEFAKAKKGKISARQREVQHGSDAENSSRKGSNWDKHSQRRSGDKGTKNRGKKGWTDRSNKRK